MPAKTSKMKWCLVNCCSRPTNFQNFDENCGGKSIEKILPITVGTWNGFLLDLSMMMHRNAKQIAEVFEYSCFLLSFDFHFCFHSELHKTPFNGSSCEYTTFHLPMSSFLVLLSTHQKNVSFLTQLAISSTSVIISHSFS